MFAKLPEKTTARLHKPSGLSHLIHMCLELAAPHGTNSHRCSPERMVAWNGRAEFCLLFPGRDYVAHTKTKLVTLFLKSLNSVESHFLVYNWMHLKDRVTFARSKNVTGNTTAKPQTLFLSSVCYATLFSPSGHSGARSPPSAYRLIHKWLLSHAFMYVN